jgi:hypothetical protein
MVTGWRTAAVPTATRVVHAATAPGRVSGSGMGGARSESPAHRVESRVLGPFREVHHPGGGRTDEQ